MTLRNTYCTVAIGPTIPIPLPSNLTEAICQIEVMHHDSDRSGFKIEFYAGRQGLQAARDYPILQAPFLKVFNRVKILITVNGIEQMLMDGVITDIQLQPSDSPGDSRIIVMGQDISILMDRKQVQTAHPAQAEIAIVSKIIADYAKYRLVPKITRPPLNDIPNIIDWIPRQYDTDYVFLKKLARRFGYIFYVATGPTPGVNTAYWGPPKRIGVPQSGLCANMGYGRNINEIYFRQNALAAATVYGKIQDRKQNTSLSFHTLDSTRVALSQQGATQTNTQQLLLENAAGLSYSEAQARAQGITNRSRDRVVIAEGNLDTTRYGYLLQTGNLVGVSGAGLTNDGLYYVEQVTHTLKGGYFRQQFMLTRDGTGATLAALSP